MVSSFQQCSVVASGCLRLRAQHRATEGLSVSAPPSCPGTFRVGTVGGVGGWGSWSSILCNLLINFPVLH